MSGRCTHNRAPASKPSSSIARRSLSPHSHSIGRQILGTWPLFWAGFRAWCAGMEATLNTPPQAAASRAAHLFIAANIFHAGNGSSLISRLAFAWRRAPGMQVSTCKQHIVACQSRLWLLVQHKRSLTLHTDCHHHRAYHRHSRAIIAVSISVVIIIIASS